MRQLYSIDKIARQLQHDVLYITFIAQGSHPPLYPQDNKTRQKILHLLDENKIRWNDCVDIESSGFRGWRGEVHIVDAIPIENDVCEITNLVDSLLESSPGISKYAGVTVRALDLDMAMTWADHDDLDYQSD